MTMDDLSSLPSQSRRHSVPSAFAEQGSALRRSNAVRTRPTGTRPEDEKRDSEDEIQKHGDWLDEFMTPSEGEWMISDLPARKAMSLPRTSMNNFTEGQHMHPNAPRKEKSDGDEAEINRLLSISELSPNKQRPKQCSLFTLIARKVSKQAKKAKRKVNLVLNAVQPRESVDRSEQDSDNGDLVSNRRIILSRNYYGLTPRTVKKSEDQGENQPKNGASH